MAVDMFLKLDGIEGESKDSKHGKEIDVLAWSWGASQSQTTRMGLGSRRSAPDIQDLSLSKYTDSATHSLLQRTFDGRFIKEATLAIRKAGSSSPLDYLIIRMSNVLVSSVSTGGSRGEDRLTENVTLNFSQVEITYIEQKSDGTKTTARKAVWDSADSKAMA